MRLGWTGLALALIAAPIHVHAQADGPAEAQPAAGDGATELTDEQREEAMRHFVSGSQRFEAGRFREAIAHFSAAYEIAGSPEFLYNIGRCHEELGENERAVENYEMYLRLRPEADDAEEVRGRIERLGAATGAEEEPAELPEEAEPEPEEETSEWPPGLRIGAGSGASFVLPLGEWRGTMVPLDLFLHYPLLDWLYVTGVLFYGTYLEQSDTTVAAGKAKSQLGLFAGVSAAFELSRRVGLFGRLGVVPTGVFRKNYKTATWLAFQLGAGVSILIYGGWGVYAEALGTFGPVFIRDPRIGDPWTEDGNPSLAADAGGRIGFFYAFE